MILALSIDGIKKGLTHKIIKEKMKKLIEAIMEVRPLVNKDILA
jgi:hypothetical protein